MANYGMIEEMLCEELDELTGRGKLDAGSLDAIDKLTHSIKSIKTIEAMDDGGYSNGYSGESYFGDGGYSGARGRGRNARRDSMGRYSRDGYSNRRGYSRDGEKEQLMQELDRVKQKIEQMGD